MFHVKHLGKWILFCHAIGTRKRNRCLTSLFKDNKFTVTQIIRQIKVVRHKRGKAAYLCSRKTRLKLFIRWIPLRNDKEATIF